MRPVNAREAQDRMARLETHGQDWNVEEFLTWLARLEDDPNDVGPVIREEADKAINLVLAHYQGGRRGAQVIVAGGKVVDTFMVAAVAFQQGMTFAAAALGRPAFDEEPE